MPEPNSPYRGILRWMEGAPSLQELGTLATLFVLGGVLLIVAWRLLRSFALDHVMGHAASSPWLFVWACTSGLVGLGLLVDLTNRLQSIAARMGIGALVLVLLLASEAGLGRRRRHG